MRYCKLGTINFSDISVIIAVLIGTPLNIAISDYGNAIIWNLIIFRISSKVRFWSNTLINPVIDIYNQIQAAIYI